MLPGKYRAVSGRAASNVNCGLHLVIQTSSLPDRNKVEFRLSKETPSFSGRLLQHDLERNYSSRQGDGRVISPVPRSRPSCLPSPASVADFCGLDVRAAASSIPTLGEPPAQTLSRPRARQGCHSAGPNVSGEHSSLVSSSMPAFPILHRSTEEKILCSDRLTLERQKLTVCPIIDGEEHLRLLNFQHNFITRIQNISNLQRLIFLDLYDNQIEEISGLSTLRSLRVLLLGKNRIKKISNLENLKSLDVLDLHGNQITRIENVNHLSDLRVLNLARNLLSHVDSLSGLHSLTELNLRHNHITFVRDVDALPSLQRLFLSFNNICSFDSVCCLAQCSSLSDISFDGNPIAQEPWYKHTVLQNMAQLRQLDMKRVTEEERRVASVVAKKEEEKKRESQKQSLLKEKKRLAICNIARQWEQLQQRRGSEATSPERPGSPSAAQDVSQAQGSGPAFPEEPGSPAAPPGPAMAVADTHLVEVGGDTLSLYGAGALECLDRSWSTQTAGTVTTICFTFIDFDDIVQVLPKLRMKFPNSLHLKFKETKLVMLQQFNALAQLRRIDQLTVDPQGNPVVSFTLWKYYALFRLSHFSMQKINGTEVTQNDMIMAERLFGILAHVASSELPQYRLISILGDARKKQFRYLLDAKGKRPGLVSEDAGDSRRLLTENTNRATLNYATRDFYNERLEEIREKKQLCRVYTEGLVREAAGIHTKAEALQRLWPQMFIELVRDAVVDIRSKDAFMKLSLQHIAQQK